jgi:hypothetical protein
MKTTLMLLALATAQASSSSTICANEVESLQSNGVIMEREARVNREASSVIRTIRRSRESRERRDVSADRLFTAFHEGTSVEIEKNTETVRRIRVARTARPARKIYFVLPDKACPKKLAFSFYAK